MSNKKKKSFGGFGWGGAALEVGEEEEQVNKARQLNRVAEEQVRFRAESKRLTKMEKRAEELKGRFQLGGKKESASEGKSTGDKWGNTRGEGKIPNGKVKNVFVEGEKSIEGKKSNGVKSFNDEVKKAAENNGEKKISPMEMLEQTMRARAIKALERGKRKNEGGKEEDSVWNKKSCEKETHEGSEGEVPSKSRKGGLETETEILARRREGDIDNVGEGNDEKVSERCSEKTSEGSLEKISEGCSEKTSEGREEKTSKGCLEKTSKGCLEKISEGCLEKKSEGCEEKTSEGCLEKTIEGREEKTSKGCLEKTSEGCEEKTSEGCEENTSEGCLEETSEIGGYIATEENLEDTNEDSLEKASEVNGGDAEKVDEGKSEQAFESIDKKSSDSLQTGVAEAHGAFSRHWSTVSAGGPERGQAQKRRLEQGEREGPHLAWRRLYDRPLPQEVLDLCLGEECRVCGIKISSTSNGSQHYSGSRHAKAVNRKLEELLPGSGQRPKRMRESDQITPTLNPMVLETARNAADLKPVEYDPPGLSEEEQGRRLRHRISKGQNHYYNKDARGLDIRGLHSNY